MVRPVHDVARHTKIHIRYNILISMKLLKPGNLRAQRCWINQLNEV